MSSSKSKTMMILAGAIVLVVIVGGIAFTQLTGDGNTKPSKIKQEASASGNSSSQVSAQIQNQDNSGSQDDPVVAIVDGKDITRRDVFRFIENQGIDMTQQSIQNIYPLALEQVVRGQIVVNKAQGANLNNDPEVLEQVEGAKKQIINTVFLQRTVDSEITDDLLNKAYEEHVAQIPEVEERRARHILLENEDKAKDLIQKVKDGEDFETLAREHSTGPTGPRGGDLGYFTKDQMVPEFAEAAFSMKTGDITDSPVKTQFGYHVIKVEDIRQRPKPDLETIRDFLTVQLRQEILNELIDEWQKKAKVEKFDINGAPLSAEESDNN